MKDNRIISDIDRICKAFGISKEARLMMQFEAGCQFANKFGKELGVNDIDSFSLKLQNDKSYWNWFRNQWLIIDRSILRNLNKVERRNYNEFHNQINAYPCIEL